MDNHQMPAGLELLSQQELTDFEGGSMEAPIVEIIKDAINGVFTVWA